MKNDTTEQRTRLTVKSKSCRALGLCMGLLAFTSSAGCVSLAQEEGRLPDAMRTTIASLTAKGYPDLTKIPDAPTALPSSDVWSGLQAGLVNQGRIVSNDPDARAPTNDETNLEWAQIERNKLEAEPLAQPLAAPVQGETNNPDWAAQARAKLDADLARLPPL
jgi:hypothetical protein